VFSSAIAGVVIMCNLYVYDFGNGDQYIVDDSGERWTEGVSVTDNTKTVFCESCYDEVVPEEAYESASGRIQCVNCFDIQHVDLSKHRGNLLDLGAGCYELINATTLCLKKLGMEIQQFIPDGVIMKTTEGLSEWRDIEFAGVIFGLSYVRDID